MTSFYQTDRTFVTRRSGVVNHLKNGGFMIARTFTPVNHTGPNGEPITKVLRTEYAYDVTDAHGLPSSLAPVTVPSFYPPGEPAAEQIVGYWDVWGTKAAIHVNREHPAYDGGNLVTVSFFGAGKVTFRQTIESFHKFLGKTVTFGLSGSSTKKGVRLTPRVDVGTKVLEGRPFFSDYFGDYYRMLVEFEIPLDTTKFTVLIELTGVNDSLADISGATLALGSYAGEIPFSESLPDIAIPSGTIIGWAGESCPSGFRSLGDNIYMLQVLGDPNAVRGNLYVRDSVTRDTLGVKGDLTVDAHSHKHVGAAPGFITSMEMEGIAFDKATPGSAAIEMEPTFGAEALTRSNNTKNKILIDREGPPERTGGQFKLKVVPEGSAYLPHKHTFRFSEEDVEPPHVRIRLCEKI
jgi:hypothetical protein